MNRDQKAGREYSKHISMELTADGARVTNLSLEGSRLVLTIEAELADSQLRSTNPEPVRPSRNDADGGRGRDDTKIVSHGHSADTTAIGFACPGETDSGQMAMGSENLPPAPAAYMPGTRETPEPVGEAPKTAAPEPAPQTPPPHVPPPLPSAPVIPVRELIEAKEARAKTGIATPPPLSPQSILPSLSEENRTPAILGESVKPLTESEAKAPAVEPWLAPELSPELSPGLSIGGTLSVPPPLSEIEPEPKQEPKQEEERPETKPAGLGAGLLALSEESSTVGGVRHGEPQPAISFGAEDFPPLPAMPESLTPELPPEKPEPPQPEPAPEPAKEPEPTKEPEQPAAEAPKQPEPPKPADEPSPESAPPPKAGDSGSGGDKESEKAEGGTTVMIRYTCPKCKTQGMQAVDRVGTVVNCSNCGKAMRLVMKK